MTRLGSVVVLAVAALSLAAGAAPAGAVRPNQARAVSCPTVSLCVAVDDAGNVVTSTNPTGGPATWKAAQIDGRDAMSGVSCASVTLCVAFDEFDNVLSSSNPAGGAGAWKRIELDDVFDSLSCPSATLCVGVHDADVLTSTNPTGGAAAWTDTEFPGRHALFSVSCASNALCVAPDLDGSLLVSTNPTGGVGAWTSTAVGSKSAWFSIACVPDTGPFCATLDGLGNAASTTSPSAAAGTWTVAAGAPSNFGASLACPTAALCVAAGDDNISTTANPTGGAGSWHPIEIDRQGGGFVGLSCPSITLCVAIDEHGNALVSTNPGGGVGAWTSVAFDHLTHVISRADLLLDMRASLDVLGQAVPKVAKMRTSGYQLTFDSLDTGRLAVGWYEVPPGAQVAKSAKPILVAVGRSRVPNTGRSTVTIKLTAAGRKLVAKAHGRPITLRARAVLTRASGAPLTATKTLRCARSHRARRRARHWSALMAQRSWSRQRPATFRYLGENPSQMKPTRAATALDARFSGWMLASTRCSFSGPNASASTSESPAAV